MSRTLNRVHWTTDPADLGGIDYPVWVDVSSIDRSWANDIERYVGANGTGMAIQGRYPSAGRLFASGVEVHMVYLTISPEHVSFTDGRHRFAWLRDHGALAVPVMVPRSEIGKAKRLFGTRQRTTYWLGD